MRLALVLSVLALLTACTVRETAPIDADWQSRQQQISELDNWGFNGRMAVKSDDPGIRDGQVSVRWQQAADISRIRMSGPLGAGAWQLVWGPESISVTQGGEARSIEYSGADAAEQFMQRELGWAFPANSIRYWVRGLPDPSGPYSEELDEDGRTRLMRQHDWEVEIDKYRDTEGLPMPGRITFTGRGVRLRVAIARWDIGEP